MNPPLAPLCPCSGPCSGAGRQPAKPPARHRASLWLALAWSLVVWLQGCSTAPDKAAHAPAAVSPPAVAASQARNARDYRRDAAQHLYTRHATQIYKGRLPPMLYAVGVLHVDIGRQGQVLALHWQRAPRHAPEVMADIERMVRAAAPYPAPQHLAQVTYTDVWLWDKSGRFQLDTLTEGQD